jgi:hypothetical protein
MTMTPAGTIKALKSYLESDTSLDYIETVAIRKYSPDALPPFDTYCIVISPHSRGKKSIANRLEQKVLGLDVYCIVRNFDPVLSLVGEPPDQVGIIKMIDDVEKSLRQFVIDKQPDVCLYLDEVDEDIDFTSREVEGREDFVHEFPIPFSVKLKEEEIKI